LTLLVARIPIIQKLAILCSFWIISIFISVVTLLPIILSFTPPPAEEHVSGRTPLERFMSWMMVVALAWLFWLYDYISGVPVAAMLAIAVAGLVLDLSGFALPIYAQVGFAISHATDVFGTFFGRVYVGIERSLIWLSDRRATAGDGGRARLAPRLRALLQHLAEGRRHHAGRRAPLSEAPVQRRVRQGEREVPRRESARHHRRGQLVLHRRRKACEGDGCKLCRPRGGERLRGGEVRAARGRHQGCRHA
jgi:hypothetical protein